MVPFNNSFHCKIMVVYETVKWFACLIVSFLLPDMPLKKLQHTNVPHSAGPQSLAHTLDEATAHPYPHQCGN